VPSALSAELAGHVQFVVEVEPVAVVEAPSAHAVQLAELVVAEYVPCGHALPLAPSICFPAGQAHVSAPPTVTAAISGSPHAHAAELEDPSGLAAPAGQLVHDTTPVASLNVLAGQLWHVGFTALGPNVPGWQSAHPLLSAALVLPLPHEAQSAAEAPPAAERDVPAGHLAQSAMPVESAYVPARHAGQVEASASEVAVPLAHWAQLAPHTCEAEAEARRYHPPPWRAPHA
jgi:hypothetical protein